VALPGPVKAKAPELAWVIEPDVRERVDPEFAVVTAPPAEPLLVVELPPAGARLVTVEPGVVLVVGEAVVVVVVGAVVASVVVEVPDWVVAMTGEMGEPGGLPATMPEAALLLG